MARRSVGKKQRQRMKMLKTCCSHCYYCGQYTDEKDRTIDHKTPLSRGGTNSRHNQVMACIVCNREKADMTEKEYKKYRNIKRDKEEKERAKIRKEQKQLELVRRFFPCLLEWKKDT